MVIASGLLTVNDAMVKWLTQTYPVGQVMSLRGAFVIAIVVVSAMARHRISELRVSNWRLQLTRGALMAISTFLFVTALALMPIADAIAIAFAGPVIATSCSIAPRFQLGFFRVLWLPGTTRVAPFSMVKSSTIQTF